MQDEDNTTENAEEEQQNESAMEEDPPQIHVMADAGKVNSVVPEAAAVEHAADEPVSDTDEEGRIVQAQGSAQATPCSWDVSQQPTMQIHSVERITSDAGCGSNTAYFCFCSCGTNSEKSHRAGPPQATCCQ